jgi:hypothetical protein
VSSHDLTDGYKCKLTTAPALHAIIRLPNTAKSGVEQIICAIRSDDEHRRDMKLWPVSRAWSPSNGEGGTIVAVRRVIQLGGRA